LTCITPRTDKHNIDAVQDVPDPNDASTWTFQVQATWKSQAGEDVTSLSALKHCAASTFAEPFKSIFLNIPDDTRVYENKMNYWVPQRWDSAKGRLALLGDAVHPMTFRTHISLSPSLRFGICGPN
jgi:2-polyprenyl-6-methoxyphenol hydroxylase-like FAD-dependent oxidoreductase